MNAPSTLDPRNLDLTWPEEGHTRVPYRVYTDQAIYDLEQERIFRGATWNYVALTAELPDAGDYRTTHIGDTPVIVTRDRDGEFNVLVNRCAHRGALVCRDLRGNADTLTCVYHQWAYDAKGDLIGVPFRKGLGGKGGYPKDFDMAEHGLEKLKVEVFGDCVFATFDHSMPSVETYFGQQMADYHRRMFNRPVEVIGYHRQYMRSNWKLYADNTHDPYHASQLHLFHATFGLYRASQICGTDLDPSGLHNCVHSKAGSDEGKLDGYRKEGGRSYDESYSLADPSVLAGWPEFADGDTLCIHVIFPNLVAQQIANTLATRQIVTHGPDAFELIWTYFGYVDDTPEQRAMRIKQINLIGPAGLISMEDGYVCEMVQDAIVRDGDEASVVLMGGESIEGGDTTLTESGMRGFWRGYRRMMDL
ncbi:MAG: Rieske 2Fe-2S domain-containing protein [Pseudomonadota bacterium]|nr:Rieske 2Fe-2S domain-containing protein [Pseudomonadota bacterium]